MTERLMCSNCGGPVTRKGNETRVTCAHCQNVTEFAPLHDDDDDDDLDDSPRRRGGGGGGDHIPNIVIIQAPTPIVQHQAPQPVVQSRPVIIVRRQSSFARFILGPVFFILLFVGISTYIRMRAAKIAESANSSEKAAEKAGDKAEKAAEKAGEKAGEKKHH